MNTSLPSIRTSIKKGELRFQFDVGHSSIGWSALQVAKGEIQIAGAGTVIFRADDCLASTRRGFRRQRRHIRSTRQRIARMKKVLEAMQVLSPEQLDAVSSSAPWKLAARVLAGEPDKEIPAGHLLSWAQFWDVLRWYAHNRGYDGNRRWSAGEEAAHEDTEKEENARNLMVTHGVKSMAETFCKELGVDPFGVKGSSMVRFKGLNAAFPREVVELEVKRLFEAHARRLAHPAYPILMEALLKDWKAAEHLGVKLRLPNRYEGGLLFGQLVPRFDNRIIATCPISGGKVPSRNCPEFFDFRWAMQLANIRVGQTADRELRPLTAKERRALDAKIRERGYFTPGELKATVREATGCERSNLATMLMHPDAKDALVVDPVQKLISSDRLASFWSLLPERLRKRYAGQLRKGKEISLMGIRAHLMEVGESPAAFDRQVQAQLDSTNTRSRKGQKSREEFLREGFVCPRISGRGAFSRDVLRKAFAEVMNGKHPTEEGMALFRSETIREAHLNRQIAEQTNNHLIRHRLLILQRLLRDMIGEFADGERARVSRVTIEVTRDLREMSGKTNKEIEQDLGRRLANFKSVVKKLETDEVFMEALRKRGLRHISPGLIRKARIAEDLDWTCPYTGQPYDPIDLLTKRVDKDHIIPRSERISDSLDSLVITFSAVNKWKGKRTALKFVEDEQGKPVPDLSNLSIIPASKYKQFVDGLETFRGHDDDKKRKKKRKELLMLSEFEEKEFIPRDLTQTSQLVRLGAMAIRKEFLKEKTTPVITSLPGSVTGTLRKGWNKNLLGSLCTACPQVLDANGEIRPKTEIRGLTHLHHALDAVVLGLADHYIPNNGRIWELILKRKLDETERTQLRALGIFDFSPTGFGLKPLPEVIEKQLRARLKERRVVQHIPARMHGLRVEQNTWGVISVENGDVNLRQRIRQPDNSRPQKTVTKKAGRVLGLSPKSGSGKLQALKGVLVIPDNFGVALDPVPTIIPFHKVWTRLQELKVANGGKMPRIIRNGQIITIQTGKYTGTWRVFSAKNNTTGIALDMAWPDVVTLSNKTEGHKINVLLSSLLKNGIQVTKIPLTGMAACPSTLSA